MLMLTALNWANLKLSNNLNIYCTNGQFNETSVTLLY